MTHLASPCRLGSEFSSLILAFFFPFFPLFPFPSVLCALCPKVSGSLCLSFCSVSQGSGTIWHSRCYNYQHICTVQGGGEELAHIEPGEAGGLDLSFKLVLILATTGRADFLEVSDCQCSPFPIHCCLHRADTKHVEEIQITRIAKPGHTSGSSSAVSIWGGGDTPSRVEQCPWKSPFAYRPNRARHKGSKQFHMQGQVLSHPIQPVLCDVTIEVWDSSLKILLQRECSLGAQHGNSQCWYHT